MLSLKFSRGSFSSKITGPGEGHVLYLVSSRPLYSLLPNVTRFKSHFLTPNNSQCPTYLVIFIYLHSVKIFSTGLTLRSSSLLEAPWLFKSSGRPTVPQPLLLYSCPFPTLDTHSHGLASDLALPITANSSSQFQTSHSLITPPFPPAQFLQ